MSEWLDVVNEKDEVIEKAAREECHRKKLMHRAIKIFILNPKGELFIQKRSAQKDVYPGYYEGSLSGHVMSGETYEEAAQRELKEEVGISAELKKTAKFNLLSGREVAVFTLFLLENYGGQIKLNHEEAESGKFESLEKIHRDIAGKKKKFTPGFVKAFEMYFKEE